MEGEKVLNLSGLISLCLKQQDHSGDSQESTDDLIEHWQATEVDKNTQDYEQGGAALDDSSAGGGDIFQGAVLTQGGKEGAEKGASHDVE